MAPRSGCLLANEPESPASTSEQRDLTWLDWSTVADLSRDDKRILFYEWGEAVSANPVVHLRTPQSR